MNITFEGPALFVADITRSRIFYETIMGQDVLADHGRHVAFKGGFSIWQADYAISVVFEGAKGRPKALGLDNFEMYFESGDLDAAWERVAADPAALARAIHPVRVHPWGQRGFRLRDPDGHIVEVGEPLPLLVRRLMAEGMTYEEIAKTTSIPLDAVKAMADANIL